MSSCVRRGWVLITWRFVGTLQNLNIPVGFVRRNTLTNFSIYIEYTSAEKLNKDMLLPILIREEKGMSGEQCTALHTPMTTR